MAALDRLSPEHRALVQLVLGEGRSADEVASLLDLPPARVRQLSREALDQLAATDDEQGDEAPDPEAEPPAPDRSVKAAFAIYLTVIVAGLVFFTAIGLTHQ